MSDVLVPELGPQTRIAAGLYNFGGPALPMDMVRCVLTVKLAACRCNREQGWLPADKAQAIEQATSYLGSLDDARLRAWFPLDAWQGGAGTSLNINANEAISLVASRLSALEIDPLEEVNLHQSTNDVVPSAFRMMLLDRLVSLEQALAGLQDACQNREQAWAGQVLTAHTQLQDAVPMDAGKLASTWSGALGRDRWRCFKARERLKELNIGGTAIGSGLGAPRDYVLGVIRHLADLSPHPLCRAEDPVEATSNYDGVLEAMETLNIHAATLKRIATDIRLLASGPHNGLGILETPGDLKGSSIMPGKTNPVLAEASAQVAMRLMANHSLLAQVCSQSELQLNPYFPLILQTCRESLDLLTGLLPAFSAWIRRLRLRTGRSREGALVAGALVLVPLLGYRRVEALTLQARQAGLPLFEWLQSRQLMPPDFAQALADRRLLFSLGHPKDHRKTMESRFPQVLEALSRQAQAGLEQSPPAAKGQGFAGAPQSDTHIPDPKEDP